MIRLKLLILLTLIFSCHLSAQDYYIDASSLHKEIRNGQLKMGNPGPEGEEILINNQYMTIGGKPVIPVMGEFHYSRYPREQWKDVILKMKACGINIIATYVFWIHHEEIEGQFDWTGNMDLMFLCTQSPAGEMQQYLPAKLFLCGELILRHHGIQI